MHSTTKHFFKAGFQLGPWRITRKVLTFIIAFCLFVIAFGCVVLKYHVFEKEGDWAAWDEDDSSEAADDDDDEDTISVSGGDALMLVLMVAAGAGVLMSLVLCFLSHHNVPDFLESGDSTVYTIQYEKNPGSTRSAPGQGPVGEGLRGPGARSPRSAREAMTGRAAPYTISNGAYPSNHPHQNNNNNNTTPYAPSHNTPPAPYCPPYYPTPPPSYPSQFYAKTPLGPAGSIPSAPPPPLGPADLPPPYAP